MCIYVVTSEAESRCLLRDGKRNESALGLGKYWFGVKDRLSINWSFTLGLGKVQVLGLEETRVEMEIR